jgi:hypothetical protein
MPASDGSDYSYVLDLKYFDTTKTRVDFPHFSAHGSKFYISFTKTKGKNTYGCFLHSDSSGVFPGTIHYRFDFVKKEDHRIVKTKTFKQVFFNIWLWDIRLARACHVSRSYPQGLSLERQILL